MSDIERYGVIALTVMGLLLLGILMKDQMPWADDPAAAQATAEVAAGRKVPRQPIVIPRTSQPPAKRLAPVSTPAPKAKLAAPRVSTPAKAESAAPLANFRVSDFDGMDGSFRIDEPGVSYNGPNASKPEPVAAPQKPSAGAPRMHTIEAGDTLGAIAARYIGNEADWEKLVEWNPGLDPRRLKIGQKILVSRQLGDPAPAVPASDEPKPSGERPKTYEVQPGDTLSGIASKVMGSIKYTDALYEANRDVLSSKNALKVGQTLKIP